MMKIARCVLCSYVFFNRKGRKVYRKGRKGKIQFVPVDIYFREFLGPCKIVS